MTAPYEKLKWRCRRGAVELDLLLWRYLEDAYGAAEPEEQERFSDLLSWEDNELFAVIIGGKDPGVQGFDNLIRDIACRR